MYDLDPEKGFMGKPTRTLPGSRLHVVQLHCAVCQTNNSLIIRVYLAALGLGQDTPVLTLSLDETSQEVVLFKVITGYICMLNQGV